MFGIREAASFVAYGSKREAFHQREIKVVLGKVRSIYLKGLVKSL